VSITPHPALSHKGRGSDVVGKLVAHLTSPIKEGEGDEEQLTPNSEEPQLIFPVAWVVSHLLCAFVTLWLCLS